MMFPNMIKYALVFVVLIVHLLIIQKIKLSNKSKIFIRFLALALCVAVLISPIESIFRFETPESAFQHTMTSGKIVTIEDGADSCAILYQQVDGSYSVMLVLKNETSYQKCPFYSAEEIFSSSAEAPIHTVIYHVKNTEDFYLCILGNSTEEIQITDSVGTDFETPCEMVGSLHTVKLLKKIDYRSDYELHINGIQIISKESLDFAMLIPTL